MVLAPNTDPSEGSDPKGVLRARVSVRDGKGVTYMDGVGVIDGVVGVDVDVIGGVRAMVGLSVGVVIEMGVGVDVGVDVGVATVVIEEDAASVGGGIGVDVK
jgi:hypothetical protein